eukprot:565573-Pleurochrysis_carterae.AAC.1
MAMRQTTTKEIRTMKVQATAPQRKMQVLAQGALHRDARPTTALLASRLRPAASTSGSHASVQPRTGRKGPLTP